MRQFSTLVRLGTLAAIPLVLGCRDDPTANTTVNEPRAIAVGQVVSGAVAIGDTAVYTLSARAGDMFNVLLETVTGAVSVEVWTADGRVLLLALVTVPDDSPLGRAGSDPLPLTTDLSFRIVVYGAGTYRLMPYVTQSAPEHVLTELRLNDTLSGEDLLPFTDVDEFQIVGAVPGEQIVIYLRAADGAGGGSLLATLVEDAVGNAFTVSSAGDTSLQAQSSARFEVPASGEMHVRVRGTLNRYVGSYELSVRRIDKRPEHSAVALVSGDTLESEAIDYVGDIDEFTIIGNPGDTYNLMLASNSAQPTGWVQVDVPDVLVANQNPSVRGHNGIPLLANATGNFLLPSTGRATVRLWSVESLEGLSQYRVFLYRVNAEPEHSPVRLTVGDSIVSEQLDAPGDVDEFHVTLDAPTHLQIRRELDPHPGWSNPADVNSGVGALFVELAPRTNSAANAPSVGRDILWQTGTGMSLFPAGEYTLRVRPWSERFNSYYGPYRIFLDHMHPEPEGRSATVAVGDTVMEALEPYGDVDTYTLVAAKGEQFQLSIQGLDDQPDGSFVLGFRHPSDFNWAPVIYGFQSAPNLETVHSGRIIIRRDGPFELRVWSNSNGRLPDEHGHYRFVVRRVSATPEHHSTVIGLGEVVSDEPLDYGGDADVFQVSAPPGTEAIAFLTASTSTQGLLVEAVDPTSGAVLRETQSYIATEPTGRFVFPPTGSALIRVSDATDARVGPYEVRVIEARRTPESSPIVLTVGDTVRTEAIDYRGDIDEFVVSLSAGQRVRGHFQPPTTTADPFHFELMDAATGQVIATATTPVVNVLQPAAFGPVVIPSTGQYVLRVRSVDDRMGDGLYWLTLERAP